MLLMYHMYLNGLHCFWRPLDHRRYSRDMLVLLMNRYGFEACVNLTLIWCWNLFKVEIHSSRDYIEVIGPVSHTFNWFAMIKYKVDACAGNLWVIDVSAASCPIFAHWGGYLAGGFDFVYIPINFRTQADKRSQNMVAGWKPSWTHHFYTRSLWLLFVLNIW